MSKGKGKKGGRPGKKKRPNLKTQNTTECGDGKKEKGRA